MRPDIYFKTLSVPEKKAFAATAGTTFRYVGKIFTPKGAESQVRPNNEMIVRMVAASEGRVSLDEAIDYFLVQPVKKLAAELDQPSQVQAMPVADGAEVKSLDSNDKPSQFRRVVGRDFEQMGGGI